eukprot:scaffold5325_cov183-Amphora_coffeaeformis.AAC.5
MPDRKEGSPAALASSVPAAVGCVNADGGGCEGRRRPSQQHKTQHERDCLLVRRNQMPKYLSWKESK